MSSMISVTCKGMANNSDDTSSRTIFYGPKMEILMPYQIERQKKSYILKKINYNQCMPE